MNTSRMVARDMLTSRTCVVNSIACLQTHAPPHPCSSTSLLNPMKLARDSSSHGGGMPRPTSMLFDLEMEDATCAQQLDHEAEQAVRGIHNLVARAMAAAAQTVRDVDAACQALFAKGHRSIATAALAEVLAGQMGYSVSLRESLGGGAGGQCLRNLRHSCLVLQQQNQTQPSNSNHSSSASIIVDPTFKDQFAIAHPSLRYAAVLEALPSVYVGHIHRLQPLVELLCAEMSLAFHSTGIVLPPWRYAKSMLSKWQPRRSVDLSLPPAAPAGAAGAAQQQQGSLEAAAAAAASRSSAGSSSMLHGFGSAGTCGSGSNSSAGSNGCAATARCSAASGTPSCITHSAAARHLLFDQAAAQHVVENATINAARAASSQPGEQQQMPVLLRQASGACGLLPAAAAASEAVPVKRQQSFEPLQRVVGGFAFSLTAGQSSLVQ